MSVPLFLLLHRREQTIQRLNAMLPYLLGPVSGQMMATTQCDDSVAASSSSQHGPENKQVLLLEGWVRSLLVEARSQGSA